MGALACTEVPRKVLWAVMVEAIVLGSLLAAQAHTRGYRISKVC